MKVQYRNVLSKDELTAWRKEAFLISQHHIINILGICYYHDNIISMMGRLFFLMPGNTCFCETTCVPFRVTPKPIASIRPDSCIILSDSLYGVCPLLFTRLRGDIRKTHIKHLFYNLRIILVLTYRCLVGILDKSTTVDTVTIISFFSHLVSASKTRSARTKDTWANSTARLQKRRRRQYHKTDF